MLGSWCGTLVPRISIKTYNLLQDGCLHAWINISVPREVLAGAGPEDSLASLSADMRHLMESGDASADALLLTSDGGKLPAHLAILRIRSSLLSSCTILNESKYDIGIMVDGRSPVKRKIYAKNAQLTAKPSSVNTAQQCTDNEYSSDCESTLLSQYSNSENEENYSKYNGNNCLNTRIEIVKNPSKTMNNKRACTNVLYKQHMRSPLTKISCNSPSNKTISKNREQTASLDHDIVRDLNQCFIECNDTKNVSLTSNLNNAENTSVSSEQKYEVFKENYDNVRLNENRCKPDLAQDREQQTDKVLIKVSMSSSVTKQFLQWIYTGKLIKYFTIILIFRF